MERKPLPRSGLEATEAPLPAERAFVVQLRGASDPTGELFVGRVEHIASGAVGRFASADGLLAFIQETLAPRHQASLNVPRYTGKGTRRS